MGGGGKVSKIYMTYFDNFKCCHLSLPNGSGFCWFFSRKQLNFLIQRMVKKMD